MAQDATGATTAKGIPKYNTAADPPSGKGFNAAMDQIDTILSDYAQKPSGTSTGECMVWNGTAWARSSVTRLSTVRPQDLTQDAATTGQVLAWNGSIWAPASGTSTTLVQADFTEKGAVNSSAEFSFMNTTPTITGGSLGSNGALHILAWGRAQQAVSSTTWTYKLKLGGTAVYTYAGGGGGSTDSEGKWVAHFIIRNTGATNAQVSLLIGGTNTNTHARVPDDGGPNYSTAAIDTSTDKTFDFTGQMSSANGSQYLYRAGSLIWIDTLGI